MEIAAAAPRTPFAYYHSPRKTDVAIRCSQFLKAAEHRLPTLQGCKFTGPDVLDFKLCVDHAGGKYALMFGWEHMPLTGLTFGGSGGPSMERATPLRCTADCGKLSRPATWPAPGSARIPWRT